MAPDELFGQWGRLFVIFLLLCALLGTFVWSGTATYDTEQNSAPNEENVAPSPEAYVGERVTLNGVVIGTDPVTIQIWYDSGTWVVTLEDADTALVRGDSVTTGDEISAYGALTEHDTLETDRAFTREPWESTYMYAISVIGAIWVLGRSLVGWRFDRTRLAFVPRESRRTGMSRRPSNGDSDPAAQSAGSNLQSKVPDTEYGEHDG